MQYNTEERIMKADKYVCVPRMLKRVFKAGSERRDGLAGVACGKIKGGREVRIRLSRRMLELLSDFLVRIMEHSLKKAFARATGIPGRSCSLSLSLFCLSSYASTAFSRSRSRDYLFPIFFSSSLARDFSFVLSNENSKPFADERDEI